MVNVANQPRILKLVNLELTKNPSITLQSQKDLLDDHFNKLAEFKKLHELCPLSNRT